jgi:hypothetical protein
LHVFPKASFIVADKMLADSKFNTLDDETLLEEVRATFFRVFNQERSHARNDDETMRFTVTRLKDGDWGEGLDTVIAEADERKHDPYAAFFANNAPPEPQPGTEAEAQAVWDAVLETLESETTRANHDNWLRDTKALGLSSGRTVVIVQVANDKAVEALSDRHAPIIERALSQALEHGDGDLPRTLMSVAFVTTAMLPQSQPAAESSYPHAEQAQRLWQDALADLEGQMTPATFDSWFRDSKALGVNGDGQTLVIRVKNQYAIEWLQSRLYNVTHRTLVSHLEYDEDEFADLGLAPETVRLRFVTPEMLTEGFNDDEEKSS